ncbi:MAG: aldehyde dehydrogenase [Phycisphaera sp.]|nr:aldehyde dehydrogenase [Phycisphaera sp.]
MIQVTSLIGTMQSAGDEPRIPVIDPATAAEIGSVPVGTTEEVDRAVTIASEAFPVWSGASVHQRAAVLHALADAIDANRDELARLESRDQGKPFSLARDLEIPRAAANLRFFADAIRQEHGEFFDLGEQGMNYTLRRPRGVVGCISPWNLPLYLFTWKIAPALATGNTVVAKPSEVTPLSAHRFSELATAAGLPPGVLNVVQGRGDTVGARIVEHPEVSTITFTGGTSTGEWIARTAAPMFKRLSLELGGKNPIVVCEDADLEAAMPTIVRACFQNQGEICTCGSRILVHRDRLKAFMARFLECVNALKVGDPLDEETDLGPLVSADHRDKVEAAIARAVSEGGTLACGGGRPSALPERVRDGYFLQPTVLMGLDQSCATNQEEIFGPVVTVQGFDTHGEAVTRANATGYGLACSIWTRDLDRAHRMAARIESGMIWVNSWMLRDLRTPFGGMKRSGIGREGGADALRFFTEPRSITIAHSGS